MKANTFIRRTISVMRSREQCVYNESNVEFDVEQTPIRWGQDGGCLLIEASNLKTVLGAQKARLGVKITPEVL